MADSGANEEVVQAPSTWAAKVGTSSQNPLSRNIRRSSAFPSLTGSYDGPLNLTKKRKAENGHDEVFADTSSNPNAWQQVQSKQRKKPAAVGKRNNCAISGGQSLLDVFVSHLVKSTGAENLKSFIESENVTVIDIEKKSKDEARFESYKVTVERKHYEQLCGDGASNFWPDNVFCRPFVKPKVNFTAGTINNSSGNVSRNG